MMPVKWIATSVKGIRYYEHPNRKHGRVRNDRYYAIRYQSNDRRVEEGLGWERANDEKRSPMYNFPSKAECRKDFEKITGFGGIFEP
jgi:hypothetical protein